MPTYTYACTVCNHSFDIRQSFSDDPLTDCPECAEGAGRLRKVIHPVGISFKGSGFYKTDSRAAASGASNGSSSKEGGGSASEGSSDGSSAASGSAKEGSGSAKEAGGSSKETGGSSNGSSGSGSSSTTTGSASTSGSSTGGAKAS